jgi:hypothetical protein
MHGGSGVFDNEGEERYTIPTTSGRQRTASELERLDLGTSDVNGCEGEDGDDANANQEDEASPADDGSKQNVEV